MTTTATSSFTPSTTGPSSVTFNGSATVSGTVSGPQGSGTSSDTLTSPLVVVHGPSGWLVSSFVLDGRPMAEWVENATQTEGDVTVEVGALVSYGDITMVLIGIGASAGTASMTLHSAQLASASGTETGTGDFTGGSTPIGVLRFSRISGDPSTLDLTFVTGSGSTSTYHITLPARQW